jgi:hypothetical protein
MDSGMRRTIWQPLYDTILVTAAVVPDLNFFQIPQGGLLAAVCRANWL